MFQIFRHESKHGRVKSIHSSIHPLKLPSTCLNCWVCVRGGLVDTYYHAAKMVRKHGAYGEGQKVMVSIAHRMNFPWQKPIAPQDSGTRTVIFKALRVVRRTMYKVLQKDCADTIFYIFNTNRYNCNSGRASSKNVDVCMQKCNLCWINCFNMWTNTKTYTTCATYVIL